MIRQLIGSSNVYRHYNDVDFTGYAKYKMVNCTNKEVLDAALDNIGKGKGEIIISVIENLLCDAVNDITNPELINSEAINAALEEAFKCYLKKVKTAATSHPEVKFALAQPTLRPLHQWFTEGHEAFCKKLGEGIREMDLQNVAKIDCPIKMSQIFEADGVHLTPTSGKVFVNALLFNADAYFTAELINLEEDTEEMEEGDEIELARPTQFSKRITTVELEIANLKDDIIRRRTEDSLVTARIREELDFLSNTKKEDRIIVTGLTSKSPMPATIEAKKKWLKDLVGEILEKIETGSSEHILNVMQGWKGANNIPLAEVRMDSVDLASRLRKQFAEKKKAGQDFGRVWLANSVTLGTRVRIEILKAMAKRHTGERETMYVTAFTSRPMLQVRSKDSGLRPLALSFADALTRYGQGMRQGDLGMAYTKAGRAFKGQLQQNFVVLHDACPPGVAPWTRKPDAVVKKPQIKRKLNTEGRYAPGTSTATPEKRKKQN